MSAPDSTSPTDVQSILRLRARALARPPVAAVVTDAIELLEFQLARERYAVETRHVMEVVGLRELTPVPCTPAFVRGVVNVRGRITPVFDIQTLLGLASQGLTDFHHVVLVRDAALQFGLLADAVVGTRMERLADLQAPLSGGSGPIDYFKGITTDRLVVLDLGRLLADPRIIVRDEVS